MNRQRNVIRVKCEPLRIVSGILILAGLKCFWNNASMLTNVLFFAGTAGLSLGVLLSGRLPFMRYVLMAGAVVSTAGMASIFLPRLPDLFLNLSNNGGNLFYIIVFNMGFQLVYIAMMILAVVCAVNGQGRYAGGCMAAGLILFRLLGVFMTMAFFLVGGNVVMFLQYLVSFAAMILYSAGLWMFFYNTLPGNGKNVADVSGMECPGKKRLLVTGAIYAVLGAAAIIVSLCILLFYLWNLVIQNWSFRMDDGIRMMASGLLLVGMAYLAFGGYAVRYANRKDKAAVCIVLGIILLVFAGINLVAAFKLGVIFIMISAVYIILPYYYMRGGLDNKKGY